MGWGCHEVLGRFVGPLRRATILDLKGVESGQVPVTVTPRVKAMLSVLFSLSMCREGVLSFSIPSYFFQRLSGAHV